MNIVIWWHNTTCGGSWYLCSWVHSAMNYHILKLSSLEVFFCFFLPSTIYQDQKSVWYWLIADCGLRIVDCTSIVHLARLLSLLKNEWVMIWFSILSSHHMTNLALRQYFVRATGMRCSSNSQTTTVTHHRRKTHIIDPSSTTDNITYRRLQHCQYMFISKGEASRYHTVLHYTTLSTINRIENWGKWSFSKPLVCYHYHWMQSVDFQFPPISLVRHPKDIPSHRNPNQNQHNHHNQPNRTM